MLIMYLSWHKRRCINNLWIIGKYRIIFMHFTNFSNQICYIDAWCQIFQIPCMFMCFLYWSLPVNLKPKWKYSMHNYQWLDNWCYSEYKDLDVGSNHLALIVNKNKRKQTNSKTEIMEILKQIQKHLEIMEIK